MRSTLAPASMTMLALCALATVAPVRAQEAPVEETSSPTSSPTPEEHVELARVAAEAGRWDEARAHLEAALEADPRASTAFNLALVLESTGELIAARALYDQLLAGEFEALPEDRRARASERRLALSAQVATLRITASGAAELDVRVDDQPRGVVRASGSALRVEVDPGTHVVRGTSDAGIEIVHEVTVERGEVRTVSLARSPAPVPEPEVAPTPVTTSDAEQGDDTGLHVGIVVGVAAVLIAAAVIVAVVLAPPTTDEPPLPDGYVGAVNALRF
ncbi:MAG: tetratricopeptide repeat protein [Sandaracinaceae bacterium]